MKLPDEVMRILIDRVREIMERRGIRFPDQPQLRSPMKFQFLKPDGSPEYDGHVGDLHDVRLVITDEMMERTRKALLSPMKIDIQSIGGFLDHAINGPVVLQVKPQKAPSSPAHDPELFKRAGKLLRDMGMIISASGVASFLAALHGEPEVDVTDDMMRAGCSVVLGPMGARFEISPTDAMRIYRAMHAARPKADRDK